MTAVSMRIYGIFTAAVKSFSARCVCRLHVVLYISGRALDARTHTRTHARTHARMHTHTHTHLQQQQKSLQNSRARRVCKHSVGNHTKMLKTKSLWWYLTRRCTNFLPNMHVKAMQTHFYFTQQNNKKQEHVIRVQCVLLPQTAIECDVYLSASARTALIFSALSVLTRTPLIVRALSVST